MTNFIKDINWEIKRNPIYNQDGNIINGYQEITRNENDSEKSSLLSVMKNSYNPLSIEYFKDIINKISTETEMELAGYNEFKKGKIITAQLKSNKPFEIGGSKIEGYLTLGTGFDGSQSFFIGHTNEFLRCQNQFGRIVKNFTSRLTKNSGVKIEEILTQLIHYNKFETELYESFEKMQEVKIDHRLVKDCVERLIGLSNEERLDNTLINMNTYSKLNDLRDCIISECNELGDNAFALFNGVTKYSTHRMKSQQVDVFGNLFTNKGKINQQGYELITNELLLV
mgnify:CR=1 FL=1